MRVRTSVVAPVLLLLLSLLALPVPRAHASPLRRWLRVTTPSFLREKSDVVENTCQCDCCYSVGSQGRKECVSSLTTSIDLAPCSVCNVEACATAFPAACAQRTSVVESDCIKRKGWMLRGVPILFLVITAALLIYGIFFKKFNGYNDESLERPITHTPVMPSITLDYETFTRLPVSYDYRSNQPGTSGFVAVGEESASMSIPTLENIAAGPDRSRQGSALSVGSDGKSSTRDRSVSSLQTIPETSRLEGKSPSLLAPLQTEDPAVVTLSASNGQSSAASNQLVDGALSSALRRVEDRAPLVARALVPPEDNVLADDDTKRTALNPSLVSATEQTNMSAWAPALQSAPETISATKGVSVIRTAVQESDDRVAVSVEQPFDAATLTDVIDGMQTAVTADLETPIAAEVVEANLDQDIDVTEVISDPYAIQVGSVHTVHFEDELITAPSAPDTVLPSSVTSTSGEGPGTVNTVRDGEGGLSVASVDESSAPLDDESVDSLAEEKFQEDMLRTTEVVVSETSAVAGDEGAYQNLPIVEAEVLYVDEDDAADMEAEIGEPVDPAIADATDGFATAIAKEIETPIAAEKAVEDDPALGTDATEVTLDSPAVQADSVPAVHFEDEIAAAPNAPDLADPLVTLSSSEKEGPATSDVVVDDEIAVPDVSVDESSVAQDSVEVEGICEEEAKGGLSESTDAVVAEELPVGDADGTEESVQLPAEGVSGVVEEAVAATDANAEEAIEIAAPADVKEDAVDGIGEEVAEGDVPEAMGVTVAEGLSVVEEEGAKETLPIVEEEVSNKIEETVADTEANVEEPVDTATPIDATEDVETTVSEEVEAPSAEETAEADLAQGEEVTENVVDPDGGSTAAVDSEDETASAPSDSAPEEPPARISTAEEESATSDVIADVEVAEPATMLDEPSSAQEDVAVEGVGEEVVKEDVSETADVVVTEELAVVEEEGAEESLSVVEEAGAEGSLPVVEQEETEGSLPVAEEEGAEGSLPVVEEEGAEKSLPIVEEEGAKESLPIVEEEEAEESLPAVEEGGAEGSLPIVEEEGAEKSLPIVEEEEAEGSLPIVEEEGAEQSLPNVEEEGAEGSFPTVEEEGAEQSLPIVEEEKAEESLPIVEEEGAEGSLPVVEEEGAEQSLPIVEEEGAEGSLPTVEEEGAEGSLPIVEEEKAEESLPIVEEEGAEGSLPVVEEEGAEKSLPIVEEEAEESLPIVEEGAEQSLPIVEEEGTEKSLPIVEEVSDEIGEAMADAEANVEEPVTTATPIDVTEDVETAVSEEVEAPAAEETAEADPVQGGNNMEIVVDPDGGSTAVVDSEDKTASAPGDPTPDEPPTIASTSEEEPATSDAVAEDEVTEPASTLDEPSPPQGDVAVDETGEEEVKEDIPETVDVAVTETVGDAGDEGAEESLPVVEEEASDVVEENIAGSGESVVPPESEGDVEGNVVNLDGDEGKSAGTDGVEGSVTEVDGVESKVSGIDGDEGNIAEIDGADENAAKMNGVEGDIAKTDGDEGNVAEIDNTP